MTTPKKKSITRTWVFRKAIHSFFYINGWIGTGMMYVCRNHDPSVVTYQFPCVRNLCLVEPKLGIRMENTQIHAYEETIFLIDMENVQFTGNRSLFNEGKCEKDLVSKVYHTSSYVSTVYDLESRKPTKVLLIRSSVNKITQWYIFYSPSWRISFEDFRF